MESAYGKEESFRGILRCFQLARARDDRCWLKGSRHDDLGQPIGTEQDEKVEKRGEMLVVLILRVVLRVVNEARLIRNRSLLFLVAFFWVAHSSSSLLIRQQKSCVDLLSILWEGNQVGTLLIRNSIKAGYPDWIGQRMPLDWIKAQCGKLRTDISVRYMLHASYGEGFLWVIDFVITENNPAPFSQRLPILLSDLPKTRHLNISIPNNETEPRT